jgi:phage-related protein
VSAYTHVPLSTIGSLAQRAPSWAKIAAPLVVYPTKLVQDVIDNPVGSIKGAASTVAHDVTHPIDTVKNAASSVASGAKSVVSGIGHAFGSIF